ncbi:MAG: hypothetical protein HQ472_01275 [Ignavibacteria bacterium]|nr:hypothetical protein [Ignavibacteria bacterium]
MNKLFAFALILVVASVSAQSITLDEIINNNIEARGGLGKIKSLKSLSISGTMSMQGMEIPFSTFYATRSKYRMELTVQGMKIVQAYDGVTAWSLNPMRGGAAEKSADAELKQMKSQSDVIEGEFIEIAEKGNTLELVGPEDVDGATAYKIKVTDKEMETHFVFVDAATWLMVRCDKSLNLMGQNLDVEMLYSNFKDVAGVQLPAQIDIRHNGDELMSMSWDSINPNSTLSEDLFAFPKK